MISRALVVLAVVSACTTADPEVTRVRAHLERALADVEAHPVEQLTPAQQRARAAALDDLRDYIAAETFPTNDVVAERTPIFIDHFGVRCAMAYVIEHGGGDGPALVARVARTADRAYLADLAGDAELARWLAAHGLTLAEAAEIQPGYDNHVAVKWMPTVSAMVAAEAGVRTGDGTDAEAVLAAGVRVGARRRAWSDGACDHCTNTSLAVSGEYERAYVPGRGATNVVGLLLDYAFLDETGHGGSVYVIGGPVASLDEAGAPGTGYGASLGLGVSLRRTPVPVFGELAVTFLDHDHGTQSHLGLTTGVTW